MISMKALWESTFRRVGDVWEVKKGRWGAKNAHGKVRYFEFQDRAQKYAMRHAFRGDLPRLQDLNSQRKQYQEKRVLELSAAEDAERRGLEHIGRGKYADRHGTIVARAVGKGKHSKLVWNEELLPDPYDLTHTENNQ